MKNIDYVKAEEIAKVVLDIRDNLAKIADSIDNVVDVYANVIDKMEKDGATEEDINDFCHPTALMHGSPLNEWVERLEEIRKAI